MLENLFTNVFGRSKSKGSGRNSQSDTPGQMTGSSQMNGPFSMSTPQMPQPSSLPYPPAPYPAQGQSYPSASSYYPSLPFSNTPSMPTPYGGAAQDNIYGTLVTNHNSPLDSVPFEAQLTLNNSTNLVSLDQLFKEIKKAADVVERADTYLRSNQSDYDFKTEQGILNQ